jgi:hypothetical protein
VTLSIDLSIDLWHFFAFARYVYVHTYAAHIDAFICYKCMRPLQAPGAI